MEIIKCDLDPDDFLIWKYPETSQSFGSQVIVNQTQQALLFSSGELIKILDPGPHTLETANIPILKKFLLKGSNEFPFEIWFVNKIASTNFNWGTRTPIQIKEKSHGLLVNVSGYGSYEISIKDVQKIILKIVGVRTNLSIQDLREFLFPVVERETKDCIAEFGVANDIFIISTQLNEISTLLLGKLKEKFNSFGILLNDFFVQNLNINSDDPSFIKVKEAIAESASIKIKSKAIESSELGYKTERSLDVLEKLAENDSGAASAFAGAGLGLGAGINIGNQISELTNNSSQKNVDQMDNSIVSRLKQLKTLLDMQIIDKQEFEIKKAEIMKDL